MSLPRFKQRRSFCRPSVKQARKTCQATVFIQQSAVTGVSTGVHFTTIRSCLVPGSLNLLLVTNMLDLRPFFSLGSRAQLQLDGRTNAVELYVVFVLIILERAVEKSHLTHVSLFSVAITSYVTQYICPCLKHNFPAVIA